MERPIYITKIHSAFSVEEAENFDYAGESHDFWEMVFIERGTAGITAGSRVFTCLPGTLVFHKPNDFHRIWNVGQGAMQFTIISFSVQGAYAEKLRGRVISPEGELAQQLKLLQRQIADNQGENYFLPEAFQVCGVPYGKFCAALELFLYDCAQTTQQPRQQAVGSAAMFTAAVKLMQENVGQSMRARELANHLHVSLSQLKRIFGLYASTGVHEYFLAMKMDYARQLLRQGCSVSAVAEAVGFDCPNYFSAAFKREVGVTPGQYRRQDRQ